MGLSHQARVLIILSLIVAAVSFWTGNDFIGLVNLGLCAVNIKLLRMNYRRFP